MEAHTHDRVAGGGGGGGGGGARGAGGGGGSTDIGPVRSENEDSWLAVSPVFAVADGMGGHLGGAQASSKAVITLRQFLSPERLGNRPPDYYDKSGRQSNRGG